MTSDERPKGPIEQAVETLVYAPIGLFFEGPSLLPKLVEQGKTHARNARFFGRFAVQHGQSELRRRLASLEEQASDLLRGLGVVLDGRGGGAESADAPRPPGGDGAGASGSASALASASASGRSSSPSPSVAARVNGAHGGAATDGARAGEGTSPAAHELAITDYDSLAASQVVSRLAGLSGDELESVRVYEAAHRGRKTILNKIAQLQA